MNVAFLLPIAASVFAVVYDLRDRTIPNWITLPLVAVGVVWSLVDRGWLVTVGTLVIGGALCELLARMGAFGGGDLKLLWGLAVLGGPVYGVKVFYFSLLAALPVFLFYMVRERKLRPSVPYAVPILMSVMWLALREGVASVLP